MLTAASANPWVTIPVVVLAVIFFTLRQYFLKTAREIKRLEAIGKDLLIFDRVDVLLVFLFSSKPSLLAHLNDPPRPLHCQGTQERRHFYQVLPQVPK